MENEILKIKDGVLLECLDKNVDSVIISDFVTAIGDDAFRNCKN